MLQAQKELPLPPHYDPKNARDSSYHVANANLGQLQQAAMDWKALNALQNAGADQVKVHLLVIDNQLDFDFPDGSLFVGGRTGTGAMDDQDRLAQFIYRNMNLITQVTCTMDSHLPYQVFYPSAHLRRDGSVPNAFTIISADEYARGEYRPNPAMADHIQASLPWLQRQFIWYCQQLEQSGKYQLTLWPYHCLIGSDGHQLAGVVDEARLFHSFARGAENLPEIKGGSPLTEHFSIFRPEVTTTFDGKTIGQRNVKLIEKLLRSDIVIMTGQAKSHCLAWSIDDFLGEIQKDPEAGKLVSKIYLLEDCTSPVVIPGVVDYTPEADAAFARFQNAGMHVVSSTAPIETWPGVVDIFK